MLELKRTYAQVKDAHTSLLLGTAVVGFTVVTIISAPVAFLTALFALKIDDFDRLLVQPAKSAETANSAGDTEAADDAIYDSGKIGGIFGTYRRTPRRS